MKIVRVQHISVNCHGNLDATRRFYSDLFELSDIPRPDIPGIGGSWLGLGEVQLHLVDAAESGAHRTRWLPTGVCGSPTSMPPAPSWSQRGSTTWRARRAMWHRSGSATPTVRWSSSNRHAELPLSTTPRAPKCPRPPAARLRRDRLVCWSGFPGGGTRGISARVDDSSSANTISHTSTSRVGMSKMCML